MARNQEDLSSQQNQQQADSLFMKVQDIEEKQRLTKDRMSLIAQNLLETKESQKQEIIELKKQIQDMQEKLKRLVSFIETASSEFDKFAKKRDVEVLAKQAKMFQPLEFVRKSELKNLKKE
ncbi:MAG: hypothetical protein ACOCUU_02115 [Nanoarchaeota archaeon]